MGARPASTGSSNVPSLLPPSGVGQVGMAYVSSFVASGGVPPYTFGPTPGTAGLSTLPPGLSLASATGILSGTPTTVGSYTVSIVVTDSVGQVSPECRVTIVITVVTPGGGPCVDPGDDSPTGRNPRFMWSCQTQHRFNQWVNSYRSNTINPPTVGGQWAKIIKANADLDLAGTGRYASIGRWAMLWYQMTGDVAYARCAYNAWLVQFRLPNDFYGLTEIREWYAEGVKLYDWCYPVLTPTERSEFLTWLNRQSDLALGAVAPNPNADLTSNLLTTGQAQEILVQATGLNNLGLTATPLALMTTLRRNENYLQQADAFLTTVQTAQRASLRYPAGALGSVVTASFKSLGSSAAVNTTGDHADGSGAAIATPPISHTAGNLLVACVRWSNAVSQPTAFSAITDLAGNTWRAGPSAGGNITGGERTCLFYAYNALGHAANIVSVTFSAAVAFRAITVTQYTNAVAASDPLDVSDVHEYDVTPTGSSWSGDRFGDTDNSIGVLGGLAAMDLITRPENTHAPFLAQDIFNVDTQSFTPVGGLTATGSDSTTFRNDIKLFTTFATTGPWLVSTEYNPGDGRFLIMLNELTKTATGINYFPEIDALYAQQALNLMQSVVPGPLEDHIQWGDEETPHFFKAVDWVPYGQALVALLNGQPIGAYLKQFLIDLAVVEPNMLDWASYPNFTVYFPLMDPDAPTLSDWRTFVTNSQIAFPNGHLYARTGWTTTDSFFWAHWPTHILDHFEPDPSTFKLWRKGQWVVYDLLAYTEQFTPNLANGVYCYNMVRALESNGMLAAEVVDGEYAYASGTNVGTFWPSMEPGQAFGGQQTDLQENTRSVVWLPSAGSDVIVLVDRVNVLRPQDDSGYASHYPADYRTVIETNPRKKWVLHTPVSPTLSATSFTWDVGSTHVKARWLSPGTPTLTIIDEAANYPAPPLGRRFADVIHERHYRVEAVPAVDQQFDTLVTVLSAYEGADPTAASVVASVAGQAAQGVIVTRTSLPDVVLIFSSRQGPVVSTSSSAGLITWDSTKKTTVRAGFLFTTGFTMPIITIGTSTAKIRIVDLKPTGVTWTIKIDGAAAIPLLVSSQGVASLTLTGAGAHQLQVIGV